MDVFGEFTNWDDRVIFDTKCRIWGIFLVKTVQDCRNYSYRLPQSIKFDYWTHTFAQMTFVTRIPLRTIESYMIQRLKR